MNMISIPTSNERTNLSPHHDSRNLDNHDKKTFARYILNNEKSENSPVIFNSNPKKKTII